MTQARTHAGDSALPPSSRVVQRSDHAAISCTVSVDAAGVLRAPARRGSGWAWRSGFHPVRTVRTVRPSTANRIYPLTPRSNGPGV